jgi:GntR family transcriptional repressor for pyruvate dehydrogenase complex
MRKRNIKPVNKVNKVSLAVLALKEYIFDNNLRSGSELPPEADMAAQTGVSKFIMREALRVLEAQGLVNISQGRRTQVAKPSAGPAAEIMAIALRRFNSSFLSLVEARECLEVHIARFASLRANSIEIEELRQSIEELAQARKNLEVCIEKDIQFHNILVRMSKNNVFELMLAPLAELLRESRRRTIKGTGVDRAIHGHRMILQAIINRDPVQAEKAMRNHLKMAREDLKKMGISE